MLRAIVKIQHCRTRPGRKAFVARDRDAHGIAKGNIRLYEVTAPTWATLRRAVADYDTTGARTMGFSEVRPDTVVSFTGAPERGKTETRVRPAERQTERQGGPCKD